MNNKILAVVGIIIIAGISFFAGTQYQKSKTTSSFQGQGGQRGNFMQRSGQNFRPVKGEIISKDGNSITVKLADGGSKIIIVSGKTVYSKSSNGSKEDLKTGDKVMAIGSENSNGSITAQDIQINPVNRFGQGRN